MRVTCGELSFFASDIGATLRSSIRSYASFALSIAKSEKYGKSLNMSKGAHVASSIAPIPIDNADNHSPIHLGYLACDAMISAYRRAFLQPLQNCAVLLSSSFLGSTIFMKYPVFSRSFLYSGNSNFASSFPPNLSSAFLGGRQSSPRKRWIGS